MKTKLGLIIIFFIFCIFILNTAVYADFSFSRQSINVTLNGTELISYSGGSGEITWTSGDSSIATVNNGLVKGLKIGETTITATKGNETATCNVKVVYDSISIGSNESNNVSSIKLILNEHETENLYGTVKDNLYNTINNVSVNWKVSDSSIATIDASGKLKALKAGKTTVTAEVPGASDTCEVEVFDAPEFTDFSNANYDTNFAYNMETLKISNIDIKNDKDSFYFIITPSNTTPVLKKNNYGGIDSESMKGEVEQLSMNLDEKYLYTRGLAKYCELNQDLYLWIVQDIKLKSTYYNENHEGIFHSVQFVVRGQKIERAPLPALNVIIQSFNMGNSNYDTDEINKFTNINLYYPTNTEDRQIKLKIGRITNNSILTKIKNNDYSGIEELLSYAKNNKEIYYGELTTTSLANYKSDDVLFNGRELLKNEEYYYIYVELNDENGKYYPIEGVTLGQAWISEYSDSWNLWAYTSSNFSWDNFTPSVDSQESTDSTIAQGILPQTGINIFVMILIVLVGICMGIFFYKKKKNYKDI